MNHINVEPFFTSDLKQGDLLAEKMYQSEKREGVVRIKDSLRLGLIKANSFYTCFLLLVTLIRTAWLLRKEVGDATKENTLFTTNHFLIEQKVDFFKHHHNPGRDIMLNAAWDILIKVSTDPYYEWILRWYHWNVIKEYHDGKLANLGEPPKVLKSSWEE